MDAQDAFSLMKNMVTILMSTDQCYIMNSFAISEIFRVATLTFRSRVSLLIVGPNSLQKIYIPVHTMQPNYMSPH